MKINQITKISTLVEEEFIVLVNFKGQEIPFKVLKTTSIKSLGTCFTAVSIKKIHNTPNLTKGQKIKIRKLIQDKLCTE